MQESLRKQSPGQSSDSHSRWGCGGERGPHPGTTAASYLPADCVEAGTNPSSLSSLDNGVFTYFTWGCCQTKMMELMQRHLALSLAHSRCSINSSCIYQWVREPFKKDRDQFPMGQAPCGAGIRITKNKEATFSCCWVGGKLRSGHKACG